ncbi:MAG: hypothetical protein U9P11_03950 [Pseudomonadota bacterium]|nr:hypothetical protein [Pseudomonadota bacterium]
MQNAGTMRLFVCYVPGLDARRVGPDTTPCLHGLMQSCPSVKISTLPSTELVPTLISGVYPHQNGVWQVSLDDTKVDPVNQGMFDRLPDMVSTTAQCIRQKLDGSYDLAAIPPGRRRRFRQHRFKYTRRAQSPETLARFGDYPSIFGLLGPDAKYHFTKDFGSLNDLAARLPSPGLKLEFLEMYALDLTQHWNLDRPDVMREAYLATDTFIAELRKKCLQQDVTLMVLVDHGQEPVIGTIPFKQQLKKLGIRDSDYSYFAELATIRLWFHTDESRNRITELLQKLEHTTLLKYTEMHQFHVCFDNSDYGEYYLMADPGYIFFPHDFYQPLANTYLGLTDREQRSRVLNPVHRGNHGYLPQHPSEKGYAILVDNKYSAQASEIELIDFAPTVLTLVGHPPAQHMNGKIAFHRDTGIHLYVNSF